MWFSGPSAIGLIDLNQQNKKKPPLDKISCLEQRKEKLSLYKIIKKNNFWLYLKRLDA